MMSYEQEKIDVLKDLRERVFSRFCDKFEEWNNAIQCLATLDVFMSLAEYCRCEEEVMCIPTFIPAIVGKKVSSIIKNFILLYYSIFLLNFNKFELVISK